MATRRIWPYATKERPPEPIGTAPLGTGEWDAFMVTASDGKRVMFIVPKLRDNYPPDLKAAVERRRHATLYGHCDCGARGKAIKRQQRANPARMTIGHTADCPALLENLQAIGQPYGIGFGEMAGEMRKLPEAE